MTTNVQGASRTRTATEELARLVESYPAVALYGSVARGDSGPGSDVDVVVIAQRASEQDDETGLAVTAYEEAHLVSLAGAGSLFVLHLKLEARVLKDPAGSFARVFDAWRMPSIDRTLAGMRAAASVLDVTDELRRLRSRELRAVALFVLRSTVYLRCLERGQPTFALRGVARVLGAEAVVGFLERARAGTMADEDVIEQARRFLRAYLGEPVVNPFGTLEALAVSCHHSFPLASDLAVRVAMGKAPLHYASAPALWWT